MISTLVISENIQNSILKMKLNNITNTKNTTNTDTFYKDLQDFLLKHRTSQSTNKDKQITHTRIPDSTANIYGGSYNIQPEELTIFYNLYYEHVFIKNRFEYLTEKQLESKCPLAVDFDFRYDYSIEIRQHTKDDIINVVSLYLEEFKNFYIINSDIKFNIYIFEKPNVNRVIDKNFTKDGIHMIIGLQVERNIQGIIRQNIIQKFENKECWDNLPLINTWDTVLDEGITIGTTNWQLFGSRKPNNEAYKLVYGFIISYDNTDNEFMLDEITNTNEFIKNNFEQLSVQYDNHPKFDLREDKQIFNVQFKKNSKKTTKTTKTYSNSCTNKFSDNNNDNEDDDDDSDNDNDGPIVLEKITNFELLQNAVNKILNSIKQNEYEIHETHLYTQALTDKYFQPGSHLLNRKVAFALKNTDERLFLSWVMLRSKASDFDYSTISNLHKEWKNFRKSNTKNECITKRSIMYWVKKDNPDEYEKIKKQTVDYYINKSIETNAEFDIAQILKQLYKDEYVCVSYDKKGIWYHFQNHRWVIDKGLSLRNKISTELHAILEKKTSCIEDQINSNPDNKEKLQKILKILTEIRIKLKRTNDKNNIMREAAEILYDGKFIQNIDTNKNLLCFNNGVVDFVNKIFREGYPDDYITKTTNINYIEYDAQNNEHVNTFNEIDEFMKKLFPIPDLNDYMWQHLASSLIGSNKNQTFNVYHGSGSNGKSILADLMSYTLGEYKGTVPITLVTENRGKIGGTSDEILKLKGIRYAVMQEPSKGVKLNEGIMKELTGGDPIQARGLYAESETFEPQFTLVVCTNNLFDIESNDDGTWRRIRKCDFVSKFIDLDETHTDETQYIYPKDKSLKDKLPTFAPIFASILVQKAFETEGIVKDCPTVINASNKYRKNQDHFQAFFQDRIQETTNVLDKIGKRGLYEEFKLWFQREQGFKKVPKGEELYEAFNKKLGKQCSVKGWQYVKFIQIEENDTDIDNL